MHPRGRSTNFFLLGGPIFDSENTIEMLFVANYFIPDTMVPPAPPGLLTVTML